MAKIIRKSIQQRDFANIIHDRIKAAASADSDDNEMVQNYVNSSQIASCQKLSKCVSNIYVDF